MEQFNIDYQKVHESINGLVELINETFQDSNIEVKIIMNPKDETKEVEKPQAKKLKRPEELTIGEQYILFLLKNKIIKNNDIDFDNILNTIIDAPLIHFLGTTDLNKISVETQDNVKGLISKLISSVMEVDLSKLMEISPCDSCC